MDTSALKVTLKIWSKRLLFWAAIIANIVYIFWRLFYTLPLGYDWITVVFGIGLFIVEMMGMFEMFVHFFGMSKSYEPELPIIDDDLYPTVAVFISTYNEDPKILKKTIVGCKHMIYPDKRKVTIYVCDDGDRPAIKKFAKHMGVEYLRRDNHNGYKAGNLNHAMQVTESDLIVTFDADMIPRSNFLMRTVPYFMEDAQLKRDGKKTTGKKNRLRSDTTSILQCRFISI